MRPLLTLILALSLHNIFAQNLNVLNIPVPPSPTASAIIKSVEIPVNQFTGLPDINIPLFQLTGKDLSLPVTLIYNSNGFKVNELPGWIGYGWSLSCQGAISRTIMDAPDNYANGYYRDAMDNYFTTTGKPILDRCNGVSTLNSAEYVFYNQLNIGAQGQPTFYDSEPDIYSYSLPTGLSGKFVVDRNKKVRAIPKTRTKIQFNETGGGIDDFEFGVLDEAGSNYIFQSFDRIQAITRSSNYLMNGVSRLGDLYPKNAWYINQIVSGKSRDVISFAYQPETTVYKSPQTESKGFLVFPTYPGDESGINYDDTDYTSYTDFTVTGQRLSSISLHGYTIVFVPDSQQRKDLTGGYRLKQIVVKHNLDTIKNYIFYHSYFRDIAGGEQYLRLDSLVEYGSGGVKMPAYKFHYNDNLMPARRDSYAIDHWGYYNGANNLTALPRYFIPEVSYLPGFVYNINFKGANREPNFNYTQYGIINKIEYPTGGISEFVYEPNEYSRFGVEYQKIEQQAAVFINGGQSGNTQEGLNFVDDHDFTLNDTTFIWVDAIETCIDPGGGLPADCGIVILGLDNSFGQQLISHVVIKLLPGSYRLRALLSIYRTDVIGATIGWYSKGNLLVNKVGPGIRIKNIKSSDPTGVSTPIVKRYKYVMETGESSGLLHDRIRYDYDLNVTNNMMDITYSLFNPAIPPTSSFCLGNYPYILRVLESKSLNSFTDSGPILGYDRVEEISISSESDSGTPNGKVVNEYFNEFLLSNLSLATLPSLHEGNPNTIINSYSGLSGKLKGQKVYANDGKLLKEVANSYLVSAADSVYGFQAAPRSKENCKICDFAFRLYWHSSYASELASSVVKTYTTPVNFLTEQSTNDYLFRTNLSDRDSYYILKKSSTIGSDEFNWINEYRYSFDFINPPGSTVISSMTTRNVLDPILSLRVSTKDNKVYAGRLLNFEVDASASNAPVRLKKYYDIETVTPVISSVFTTIPDVSSPSAPFVLKSTVNYDAAGNLSSMLKPDDKKHSFIWAPNNPLLLIAEVANASENQIYFDGFEQGGGTSDAQARSGKFSRPSNFTFTPPPTLSVASGSILSYWYWLGNTWIYKEVIYNGGAYLIQDGSKIDNIRIIPKGALMTTYSYDSRNAITHITDHNGVNQTFEYDSFNRLRSIKDDKGNIIKSTNYHLKSESIEQ